MEYLLCARIKQATAAKKNGMKLPKEWMNSSRVSSTCRGSGGVHPVGDRQGAAVGGQRESGLGDFFCG